MYFTILRKMEKVLKVCILKVFCKRSKKIRILASNSVTRTHDLPFPADARRPKCNKSARKMD